MTNIIRYNGLNTNRLQSASIWSDCPIDSLRNQEIDGEYHFDDFTSWAPFAEGDDTGTEAPYPYHANGSDGVTIAKVADTDYGAIQVAGTDADEDGAIVVYGNAAGFARFGPTDRVWAEARLTQGSVADSNAVSAFGLIEVNVVPTSVITQVDTSGVIDASEDFVGWRSLAADGDALASVYQLGGQTLGNVTASGGTAASGSGYSSALVAATYAKYGIKWTGQRSLLEFFVNGTRVAYYVVPSSSTTFPFVNHLALIWAVKTTAAAEITFNNDWWAVAHTDSAA